MDLKTIFTKNTTSMRLEFILLIVILSAALGAVYSLFLLKSRHQREAHLAATESVIHQGDQLLNALVYHTRFFCNSDPSPEQWSNFSLLIDRILAVRSDIQSISIRNGDVTVFHRQADGLLYPEQSAALSEMEKNPTIMSRETIEIGGNHEPVFVFSKRTSEDTDAEIVLETTFKQSSVTEKKEIASRMINSLFRFTLTVISAAFLLCAAVLIAAVVRDRQRRELALQEEHLAFSGVMANGILHDFRNPMSAVRLDAQMLEREISRPENPRLERVQELAGRIARAMGRMDKVFAEFLYLAKPEDEAQASLDIGAAFAECLDILAPRLEQAGLSVRREIPNDLPPVSAHPFAIKRALLNVLMNAIHFSPEKGEILIAASARGDQAVIEICDEGPGVPPGKRKEIFNLFVSGRPEGTGLGLFLARTAINRCRGRIEAVDSARSRGAAFRISLPLAARRA